MDLATHLIVRLRCSRLPLLRVHPSLQSAAAFFVLLALFVLVPLPQAQTASDFTIVVLPDTQYYSESNPQTFTAQTQWAANNASALNIKVVLGVGDIVNTATVISEWQNADTSVKVLDAAGLPYLFALGNHEYSNFPDASGRTSELTNFNTYFGPSRYQNYSWYRGNYPAGSNENFYGLLTINGTTYLFLILELYPRDATLAWANSVLAAYPGVEVIVVTHAYVNLDNTIVAACEYDNADAYSVGADNNGDTLWKKFLSQHGNISVVLNGHFFSSAGYGTARRVDLGVNGNIVNQMLSDYQGMPDGGSGYLRILKFRPSLDTIEVSTYSPTLDAYLTDPDNQFSLQWHSSGPPPSGAATISGRIKDTNCNTVSGATVSAGGSSSFTDSDGSYTFSVTAPAAYTLTAEKSGYATVTDTVNAWTGYPAFVKEFLSTQQPGSISGKVTSTSGDGISNATLWYSGATTTTDAGGNYILSNVPVGTYTVTASQPSYQTASATKVAVNSSVNTTVDFALATATGTISGMVTNAAGIGIANATISCSAGSATTDASGAYTLSAAPGSYTLTATVAGYQSATDSNVGVIAGAATVVSFNLALAGTIAGSVTDLSGAAIANATISYSGGSATATTNASGAYTLDVAPGTYSVTATATGYQAAMQQNVTVTAGATTPVNFALVFSTGTIAGTVTNAFGLPVRKATISYSGGSATATTNARGAYTLNVAPGTYTVTAARGYHAATRQNVTVAAGATTSVNFHFHEPCWRDIHYQRYLISRCWNSPHVLRCLEELMDRCESSDQRKSQGKGSDLLKRRNEKWQLERDR